MRNPANRRMDFKMARGMGYSYIKNDEDRIVVRDNTPEMKK
jgi:hypothetical protein